MFNQIFIYIYLEDYTFKLIYDNEAPFELRLFII